MNLSPLVQRIGQWISTSVQRIGQWISTSVQRIGQWISGSRQYIRYISDRILTLPFVISVAALIVSSLHYYAVARHHRLSVKPHMNVIFYLEGKPNERNGIYIANPGLGPAIIKAVSVEVGGKLYSAVKKQPWRNVLHDLAIEPGCFRYGTVQPESVLKPGEEFALLTVTHANPPIVDGRPCHLELLKLLTAEGLKVRIQYESMYGKPHERIAESAVDSDIISDISAAVIHQVAPQLVEKLQSMFEQLKQIADKMQQPRYVHDTKHTAVLAELILLRSLYEDPPGAPLVWWLQKMGRPLHPQD